MVYLFILNCYIPMKRKKMIRKLLPMLLLLLLILTACGATNTATTPQLATALLTNSVTTTPQLVNTPTTSVTASIAVSVSVEHKAFTVNFEGFESQAELTYPAQGKAPFLTVVMFAGAGFWD